VNHYWLIAGVAVYASFIISAVVIRRARCESYFRLLYLSLPLATVGAVLSIVGVLVRLDPLQEYALMFAVKGLVVASLALDRAFAQDWIGVVATLCWPRGSHETIFTADRSKAGMFVRRLLQCSRLLGLLYATGCFAAALLLVHI
jgi:hypothetical protein